MSALAVFLNRAVVDQPSMGAVAPTSGVVARRMAALIPGAPGVVVVELGAGTGAVSAALGPKLDGRGTHLAVERDPMMLAELRRRAPWAHRIPGDARDLTALLTTAGAGPADAVLSTLPWSCFDAAGQDRVLEEVLCALRPDGVFATVTYRPARLRAGGRRFLDRMHEAFGEVVETATIWANLPPARLTIGRRPLRSAS
ncbi:class I SAM-dependent methyltransferase [Pseudonocardia phyllosphaerae]|uniref:class I SAM-dependent methyltransferase n=1 Tax=Pseudonocardia phyllosphaerae TaxID=3390502 RepID=UPI00397CC3F3